MSPDLLRLSEELVSFAKILGSVAAGKLADVIAVRGDPLRHIDVLRDPKLVIKYGRRYK